MERSYVFCGCQIYQGSSDKKSCWEWDIPTPKPKFKKISQSNPSFATPKRFDMDAINKRYSDNLYEPVNPPPLYGSGYNVHKDPETTSLDERMIDIPPELEIITSDGLDGLDMPDPNDGIDGEREWRRSFHPDPQDDTFQRTGSGYGKGVFTAGIRNVKLPKGVETPSAMRPLSNKPTISFSPEIPDDASTSGNGTGTGTGNQVVPTTPEPEAMETELALEAEGGASKLSPLEQLKSQAGKMKQRFSKISIPVRPKFNQWTGAAVKLARKTSGKVKSSRKGAAAGAKDGHDQEVPEGEEGVGGWTEPLSLRPESSPRKPVVASYSEGSQAEHAQQQQQLDNQIHQQEVKDQQQQQQKIQQQESQQAGPSSSSSNQQSVPVTATPPAPAPAPATPSPEQLKLEEEKLKKLEEEKVKLELKQKADEELKRLKAEEKLQREKEQEDLKRLKADEKLVKQREAEEQKRLKLEEKQRLDKEREDLKREKMAEKLLKDKEKEELKKQKAEEKLLQEKLTAEINKTKQEEILKAKEEQDRAKAFAEEARQMLAGETDDMSPQTTQQQSSLSIQPQPVEYSDDEADIEIDYTNKQRAAQQQQEEASKPNQEKKRRIIDLDFTKRFKRSKTPPGRPDPPKQSVASRFKFSRFGGGAAAPPDNQLASQYASEIKARDADADVNKPDRKERLREPQIFVTQPSTDSDAASYALSQDQGQGDGSQGDLRGHRGRGHGRERDRDRDFDDESEQPREYDEDDEDYMEDNDEERVPTPTKQDFKGKLKGFGKKSGQIAAATGKNVGQAMKSLGQGIKEFGVNAVQEVKAKQAAVKERDAEKKAAAAAALMQDGDMDFDDGGDAYKPSNTNERTVFKFKKRDVPPPPEDASGEDTGPMVIEVRSTRARQEEPSQQQQQQQQSAPSSVPTTPGRRSRKSSAGSRNQVQAQNQSQAQQNGRSEPESEGFVVHRSQLLGRADRDWESPLDLVQSRDQSEEPFSGNASSRDSPPGSSMASSTAHFHASRPGRAGVLEEIDSDEFFLRERGISEGEDEDEVNRFLAEELQKAFRPTRMNALDGFDLPTPPSKPGRSPRKPPRKERDSGNSHSNGAAGNRDDGNDDDDNDSTGAGEVSAAFRKYQKQSDANKNRGNNFQTFPPERPKRKRTGYVSSYMNENQGEEQEEEEEEEGDNERYREGGAQNEEEEEDGEEIIEEDEDAGFEDEGIRRVKEELGKIDKELDDYEPVNDQPVKPDRRRRKLPKPPSPPQSQLYYNTIAANEWVRSVESQIEADLDDGGQTQTEAGKKKPIQLNLVDDTSPHPHQAPVAPRRTKSKSSLAAQVDSEELNFVDDEVDLDESRRSRPTSRGQRPIPQPPLAHGESEGQIDDEIDDSLDYVDEAGYAIVHKDLPKTFPRKNKNKQNKGAGSSGSGGGSKGNSLKRRSREIRPGQGPTAGDGSGHSAGGAPSGAFFSLPRYTPRTYHIVPPTRPHRTYSVLRPKRPPRNKSKSKSNLTLEVQGQGTPRTGSATGLAAPSPAAGSSTNFNTIGSTNSGTAAGPGAGTGGGRPLTPSSPGLRRDEDRPSTAIGIMHGRPLPPPPRPDRVPVPLNDLDQASIERVVNLRHYANYEEEEEDDSSLPEVQEEPFTATNIPTLTARTGTGTAPAPTTSAPTRNNVEVEEEDLIDDLDLDVRDAASNNDSIVANSGGSRSLATSDINVAVQTDPVQDDDDYELNIAVGSFEEEIEKSEIEKHSSVTRLPSDDQTHEAPRPTDEEQQIPPPIPQRPSPPLPARPQLEAPQIVFPTRLHLDELEVDVLRVNELTANSLIIQQIRAPHIDLNSISSRGPLSIPSIQTSNLNVDNLDCNRITTNNITMPESESEPSSVPPPSFYNLRSPVLVSDSLDSSTETEDCKIDNNESGGDSCCPPDQSSPDYENVQNQNSESECPCVVAVEGSEAGSDSTTTCVPGTPSTTSNTASTTVSRTAVNPPRSRVASLPVQASEISVISHITDPDIEEIAHSSLRLGRALVRVTVRSLQAMAEFVETAASTDPECQEQQRSHMQILLCLLLVLVAGIILLGRSGSMEPRWQYFLPPHDM